MEQRIRPEEKLYRVALPDKIHWSEGRARFSSALFKDRNGTSVDREWIRSLAEVINKIKTTFSDDDVHAIVSVTADFCNKLPTHLKYDPLDDNEYHSEIHDSEERADLRGSNTKKLLKECTIEYKKYEISKDKL